MSMETMVYNLSLGKRNEQEVARYFMFVMLLLRKNGLVLTCGLSEALSWDNANDSRRQSITNNDIFARF